MELYGQDPRCAQCKRVFLPKQLIRDHIIPLAEGGQDTETNTQLLCCACHDQKSYAESERGKARAR